MGRALNSAFVFIRHFASSQVGVIRFGNWIYIYVDDEAIMDQFQSRLGNSIQFYILSERVF